MSDRLFNKVNKKKNINKIINKKLFVIIKLVFVIKVLRSMGHGEELKKFVTDLNNKIYIVCIQDPGLITLK